MHFDRLVGLRTFCRRIGVLKLARWQSEARVARRRREYTRTQRATVTIAVDGLSPRILVSDAFEYARALSWEDDAHLLRAITGRLAPGSICWDIGASVGIYTLVMAGKAGAAGAVVSFEPEPRSNARLRENVHFNKFTNVTVFDCALGSKRGQFTLNVAEHASAGTHSLATPAVAHQRRAATLIEVFPGDQILAEKLLPVPNFVKVDVEGAEEQVITGMANTLRNPRCHTLVCEVHFALLEAQGKPGAPARIVKQLQEYGFRGIEWLDRSHLFARKGAAA